VLVFAATINNFLYVVVDSGKVFRMWVYPAKHRL